MQLQLVTLTVLLALSQFVAADQEECPQLNAKLICQMAWPGFAYNDGCNGIRCGRNGMSMTTLKICRQADANSESCIRLEDGIYQRLAMDIRCKELTPAAVCATALSGFRFNDGCNYFTCDGAGSASGTMRECGEAKSKKQETACTAMVASVARKLPAATCKVNLTEICTMRGRDFYFNDGCNGITCNANSGSATTLMSCKPAAENSLTCQLVRKRLQPPIRSQGRAVGHGGGGDQVPYSCRSLSAEKICTKGRIGFAYNDGCNQVTCTGTGVARSSRMYCPKDDDKDKASVSTCEKAEKVFNDTLKVSKEHSECLTASDVCVGSNANKYFYDGCNYCQCYDNGKAGCTRMLCRKFFGSDEDFKKECVRRKARVIRDDNAGSSA